MLSDGYKNHFVPFEGEQIVYSSPPRISLSLHKSQACSDSSGQDDIDYSYEWNSGFVHLTNRRIIYLPSKPTLEFQSFTVNIDRVSHNHARAPWFGSNSWHAKLNRWQRWDSVRPSIPKWTVPEHILQLDVRMDFRDGGAFDFHTNSERLREMVHRRGEALLNSVSIGAEIGAMDGDPADYEDLPAYDDPGLPLIDAPRNLPQMENTGPLTSVSADRTSNVEEASQAHVNRARERGSASVNEAQFSAEPPPGYDQVQQAAVVLSFGAPSAANQ